MVEIGINTVNSNGIDTYFVSVGGDGKMEQRRYVPSCCIRAASRRHIDGSDNGSRVGPNPELPPGW